MNWITALSKLQSKKRFKDRYQLSSSCQLQYRDFDAVAVQMYSTDIVTYYKDGRVRLSTGGHWTVTTKARINDFGPAGWHVWSDSRTYGDTWVLSEGYYAYSGNSKLYPFEDSVMIEADGSCDADPERLLEIKEEVRLARNERAREQSAMRRWVVWAREGKQPRKPITLDMIEEEANITVKMAKIRLYGLDRYLIEIKAEVIDTVAEYSLLRYRATDRVAEVWARNIVALRMVCPSTGMVYIHAVPPQFTKVVLALDWMFQTESYLERVQQST